MSTRQQLATVTKDLKKAISRRDEILAISHELNAANKHVASLYTRKHQLEEQERKECKHTKIVYIDGNIDYDPEGYDTPERRVCLCCGLSESGERDNSSYTYKEWKFKILTATPIRRFCLAVNGMSRTEAHYRDQVNREERYAREAGRPYDRDKRLEAELNKYWGHVEHRLFLMSYPSRIKAVKKLGYP